MRQIRFARLATLAIAFVSASAWGEGPRAGARPSSRPSIAHVARAAAPSAAARAWHVPAPGKAPALDESGRPLLVLYSLNTNDRVELTASSDRGGFASRDLDRAAKVLKDPRTGNEHPFDPRLIDIAYLLQTHFRAQEIRVISGYRTPNGRSSNHGKGRAIDLVVPGATDEEVAKLAREIGFVGVGIYPVSGFVHVDVRDRSYFWIDASGPGRKNRERGILGDVAARSDASALARGERPTAPFIISSDVDAMLRARTTPQIAAVPAEEDDEGEGMSPD